MFGSIFGGGYFAEIWRILTQTSVIPAPRDIVYMHASIRRTVILSASMNRTVYMSASIHRTVTLEAER